MASRSTFTGLDFLTRKLDAITAGLRPGSPQIEKAGRKIEEVVVKGYRRMLTAGQDRKERPLAALARSTRLNPRRKPGGPLMPGGTASSFYNGLTIRRDTSGRYVRFAIGFKMPYAKFHLSGCPKGSKRSQPNWSLPQRDVGGIDLKTRQEIRAAVKELREDVVKGANVGRR